MLFPTLSFAAFFAVVLPVSWLLMPSRVRWRLFMVAASWFFYGAADWRFVPLLAGSTIVNHYFARRIYRASGPARRTWTIAAVATNLVVLAWFKYIGFLSLSAQSSLRFLGIHAHVPLPEVLLPIGISFFTFQALSYIIDTARGKIRPVSLLEFAVYLSFFPHLIAGPIVRATEFLPQIKEKIGPRNVDVGKAFWLISLGLFKKVVISSYLGTYAADPLFGFPRQHAGFEALFGVYAYAIQIYMDFSGYTDIAIGLALLLGIRFPQNFNAPYAAASLQDFWRRWHMTLSRWLRDYLYIPLGGSRQGRVRTYVNVMITMLLGGLWHGAAWTFVAWGALHGIGLCVERWRGERRRVPVDAEPVGERQDAGKREAEIPPSPPSPPPDPVLVGPTGRRPKVLTLARDEVLATARVVHGSNGPNGPNGSTRRPQADVAAPEAAPVSPVAVTGTGGSDVGEPPVAEPDPAESVMSGGALWDAVVSGRVWSRWRTPRPGPESDQPAASADTPAPVFTASAPGSAAWRSTAPGSTGSGSGPAPGSASSDPGSAVERSAVQRSVVQGSAAPGSAGSGPGPAPGSTGSGLGSGAASSDPGSAMERSAVQRSAMERSAVQGSVVRGSAGSGSGPALGSAGDTASLEPVSVPVSGATPGAAPAMAAAFGRRFLAARRPKASPVAGEAALAAGGSGSASNSSADSNPAGPPEAGGVAPIAGANGPGPAGDAPNTPRRAVAIARPALSPRARLWVGRLITFHVVCLAWIFFRATSFHNAIEVLGRIGLLSGRHRPFNWKVPAVVVGALAFQVGPRGFGAKLQVRFSKSSFWVQALILAGVLSAIDLLGPAGVAPFIYFRF